MMKSTVATPPVPMDILLIEDQDEQVLQVQEALEESKLKNHVVVIKRPMDALVYLRQVFAAGPYDQTNVVPPGLIFLDVDMSDRRGFELLHDLRSDPLLMTIPIVILTDSLEKTDLSCSMNHGVTGYFLKPMEAAQLKKVVRDVEEHWSVLSQAPCAN
jgi:CheY-like chemotaxis protein